MQHLPLTTIGPVALRLKQYGQRFNHCLCLPPGKIS
jgi:hypothetical protein